MNKHKTQENNYKQTIIKLQINKNNKLFHQLTQHLKNNNNNQISNQ
jgi:hypothetical protein